MQEAQDIFGVDFDFDEFDGYGEDQSEEEEDLVRVCLSCFSLSICTLYFLYRFLYLSVSVCLFVLWFCPVSRVCSSCFLVRLHVTVSCCLCAITLFV